MYQGAAPIVKDATSFGQWFTDSTFTGGTHVVSTLEMVPAGAGQYQFSSGSHAVYGGFFPLDPLGQFPPGTNAATPAGPGAMRMGGTGGANLCSATCGRTGTRARRSGPARGAKATSTCSRPASTSTTANPNGMWVTGLQGWFHDFWFTSEARYLFNFNGGVQPAVLRRRRPVHLHQRAPDARPRRRAPAPARPRVDRRQRAQRQSRRAAR